MQVTKPEVDLEQVDRYVSRCNFHRIALGWVPVVVYMVVLLTHVKCHRHTYSSTCSADE
jgi:hypothetical protein